MTGQPDHFLLCLCKGMGDCGCKRPEGFCCPEARDLFKRLEAAFLVGVATGNWDTFDITRIEFEAHYQAAKPAP